MPRLLEAGDRCVLVVPGESVHVAWLALPARNALQARAAAGALLATQLATPADTLHVATAAECDAAGNRLVVAVDRAVLQQWLDEARAQGTEPDVVVPDCLLLAAPPEDDVLHVLEHDGRWLVRGTGLAFAADASLAAVLVGDRPRVAIADGAGDALARGAHAPPVNLLQDAFARESRSSPSHRLRWLAAAVLLVPLVMPAASAARHAWASRSLEAVARDEVRALFGRKVADPLVAAEAQRTMLDAGNTLPRAVDALSAAIAARPGTSIHALHYSMADGVVAQVDHGDDADLAALDASLAGAGLALAILEQGEASDGRRRSRLRLEATP